MATMPARLTGGWRPRRRAVRVDHGPPAGGRDGRRRHGRAPRRASPCAGASPSPALLTGTPAVGRRAPRRRRRPRGRRGDDAPTSWSTPPVAARRCPAGWPTPARRPRSRSSSDSGFVYYGRHFRSADGSTPPAFGPLLQHYDSVSLLTLPADNGTWGVGIVTSAERRRPCAPCGTSTRWRRVVGRLPARRPLARRRGHRRRHRRHGQDRGPPPRSSWSTAGRWPPACSPSATRGRAPTRRSGAASRSGSCTPSRCATSCAPVPSHDPVGAGAARGTRPPPTTVEPYYRGHAGLRPPPPGRDRRPDRGRAPTTPTTRAGTSGRPHGRGRARTPSCSAPP